MNMVTRRPIEESDLPFLFEVYASTRLDELASLQWSQEQVQAFLNHQFYAQHAYYQEHYVGANFDLLLLDGQPIGRMYVYRSPSEIRLMEITLLPQYRQHGIGSRLIEELMDEAQQRGQAVRLHVEPFNPAMRLYLRFGFVLVEERGVYHFMEWLPRSAETAAQSDYDRQGTRLGLEENG